MSRVLYVRGFPSSFTNQDLKAKFMQFGLVKKARVTSTDQKLFGIVTYYFERDAETAKLALSGKTIENITWFVVTCEKGEQRNSCYQKEANRIRNREKTLYLKDFPSDLTTDKLKGIFDKYGLISSVFIKDKAAFVTFNDSESASKALEAEKLMKLEGKRVYVNKLRKKQTIANAIRKNKISKETPKNESDVEAQDEWNTNEEGWN